MKNYILECSVDSVESAIEAEKGGANRLELCSGLVIGGITPSKALFEEVRKNTSVRIHVLLRPRFGDFFYTEHEHQILKQEVRMFRELGADGIVIGTLNADGTLNMEQMSELIAEAGEMSVTLHRAFDVCKDPVQALEAARSLGIHTILTSGQKNSCVDGAELLEELVLAGRADKEKKVDIMIGAGVDASVIEYLYQKTGAASFHMSGKVSLDSQMEYRKEEVCMGIADMSEYQIWRTSSERVRAAKEVLDRL